MVVGGIGFILGGGGYILGGSWWWWVVVGGRVYKSQLKKIK